MVQVRTAAARGHKFTTSAIDVRILSIYNMNKDWWEFYTRTTITTVGPAYFPMQLSDAAVNIPREFKPLLSSMGGTAYGIMFSCHISDDYPHIVF